MKYKVEVKAIGGWTTHSTHSSYRDAIDQADMVHGRVVVDFKGKTIKKIHVWWDTDSGRDNEGWAIHVYGPDNSEIASQGIDAESEKSLDDVIDRGLWEVGIEGLNHDDFACTKDNGGFASWEPSNND